MSPAPGSTPGGAAAGSRRRRNTSRYGEQLREKQNLKEIFGIRDEQLRRYYREARARRAETGPLLISLLERRLDNALYRAGFAETRPQARQMASHGLFMVNGRRVTIPSLRLKVGDSVQIKESKRGKSYFTTFEKRMQGATPPGWIQLQLDQFGFTVTGLPEAVEAALPLDIQAIVELLARS